VEVAEAVEAEEQEAVDLGKDDSVEAEVFGRAVEAEAVEVV
jgi:hypothetical protein